MTNRKIEYWVIQPEADGEFVEQFWNTGREHTAEAGVGIAGRTWCRESRRNLASRDRFRTLSS
jgi:hypothetical protein